MSNIIYRAGRHEILRGTTGDFESASKFKSVLVKQGSSFLLEHPATVAGFSSLLAATASSDKIIVGITIVDDTTRNRVYFTATDPAFTGLTPGEIVVGLVIYRFVTSMSLSIPYYGIGLGQPSTIIGAGTFTFPFNTDGVAEL